MIQIKLSVNIKGLTNKRSPLEPFKFLFNESELKEIGFLSTDKIKAKLDSIDGVKVINQNNLFHNLLKHISFTITIKNSTFLETCLKANSDLEITIISNNQEKFVESLAKYKGKIWIYHKFDSDKNPKIHAHNYNDGLIVDLENGNIITTNNNLITKKYKEKEIDKLRKRLKLNWKK